MLRRWPLSFAPLLLVMLLGLFEAPVTDANLLTNGSFETPTVPVNSFTSFAAGSNAITGWTVTGNAVAVVSGGFSQAGVSFPAEDGVQWVDLTGFNINSTEGLEQGFATIPGHTYQLSYFIGNTTGGGIFGTTSTVNVSVNGTPTFSDTNSTVSPNTQFWEQFTHDFLATGTSTTLRFQNGDPATDNDNGLDNVVVLDLGVLTPTPEPASLLLVGGGLAGLLGHAAWTRRLRGMRQRS